MSSFHSYYSHVPAINHQERIEMTLTKQAAIANPTDLAMHANRHMCTEELQLTCEYQAYLGGLRKYRMIRNKDSTVGQTCFLFY